MRIRWTPLAAGHLESAHDYLGKDDVASADRTIEKILSAIDRLLKHPQMGRKGRVAGTSELVVTGTPFVIAYRVRQDSIEILAVLHGARRWPERL